jgi:hypothetical protein
MRKFWIGLLIAVLALLVLVPLGGYFWLRTSLPLTNGTVRVAGRRRHRDRARRRRRAAHLRHHRPRRVLRPRLRPRQDRLWQMEMNRRIGSGRLSEILGEATLSIDKFQRTLGYLPRRAGRPGSDRTAQPPGAGGVRGGRQPVAERRAHPPAGVHPARRHARTLAARRFARLAEDDVVGFGRQLRHGTAAAATGAGARPGTRRATAARLSGGRRQHPGRCADRRRRAPPRCWRSTARWSKILAAAGASRAATTG